MGRKIDYSFIIGILMSLTTRFHVSLPTNTSNWKHINEEDVHAKYSIYEVSMSQCERIKVILEIVFKAIATAGIYYFIYLRCTKDGKVDLENLNKRTFVHYIRNKRDEDLFPTKLINKETIDKHLVTGKEIHQHSQLLERNVHRQESRPPVKVVLLTDIFKTYIQQVKSFRILCKDIKEIIQTKRMYFLDFVHEKNAKLSEAIEKFLNSNEVDNYNFIRLMTPFLKEKDLSEILKNAIEAAAKIQDEKKTIYHEKFEEFQSAYQHLNSKLDWLISLRENRDLLSFVQEMCSFGDHYSPRFKNFYDDHYGFFNECLESMKEFKTDDEVKHYLVKDFQNWKELYNEGNKNIAMELSKNPYGVYYTLFLHLNEKLDEIGFNEDFQTTLSLNEIDINFIILFFSKVTQEVYLKLYKLMHDRKIKSDAMAKCQDKLTKVKNKAIDALEKIELPETKSAFNKMKNYFIEHRDFNDAVYMMVEIEPMVQIHNPNEFNEDFFKFFKRLKQSEFFIVGSNARCNQNFYKDFNKYFKKLDLLIAQLTTIMDKE